MPFDFRTTRDEDFVFDCVALDPDREPRLRDWLDLQETLSLQPERARDLLEASAGPAEALQHCVNARRSSRREAEARLSKLRRLRVRALPWLSAAYPLQLARLPDAAPLLLLRGAGAVEILEGPCVAIVGARNKARAKQIADAITSPLVAGEKAGVLPQTTAPAVTERGNAGLKASLLQCMDKCDQNAGPTGADGMA